MVQTIRQSISMGESEQGTNDVLLTWLQTNHTSDASPAKPVQNKRLNLVVFMMSNCDGYWRGLALRY